MGLLFVGVDVGNSTTTDTDATCTETTGTETTGTSKGTSTSGNTAVPTEGMEMEAAATTGRGCALETGEGVMEADGAVEDMEEDEEEGKSVAIRLATDGAADDTVDTVEVVMEVVVVVVVVVVAKSDPENGAAGIRADPKLF